MDAGAIALAARVVLSATLAVAAVRKLSWGRAHLTDAFVDLGIDERVGRPLAIGVPAIEVALATALVALPQSAWPGVVAALVLGGFTLFVAFTMDRGVPCPCFGGSTAPTGPRTIVRNGVLIALAVLATGPVDGAGWVTLWWVTGFAALTVVVTAWAER